MARLPGRLGTLTARDVMTNKLIVVFEQDTVETAVETLRENHITGAPVVDENNRLVGILSVKDLLEDESNIVVPTTPPAPTPLAHGADKVTWDLYDRAPPLDAGQTAEKVYKRMSQPVTSVTADAPLVEVARLMCDGHWHRLPVVDDNGELAGIITTMDVLAALVHAADERR